jgi:hypothetical protein
MPAARGPGGGGLRPDHRPDLGHPVPLAGLCPINRSWRPTEEAIEPLDQLARLEALEEI